MFTQETQNKTQLHSPGGSPAKKEATDLDTTYQGKTFIPLADIFETKSALILTLDMPGVEKDRINIKLENDILEIEGKVDLMDLDSKKPVYSEYNLGHFFRRFAISNKINRDLIEAKMKDGVLTVTLPKAQEFGPKRISIT